MSFGVFILLVLLFNELRIYSQRIENFEICLWNVLSMNCL